MKKRITSSQLKRIALAAEAFYILSGAETGEVTDQLSEDDKVRFQNIQEIVAFQWLRRAGFSERPASTEEIFKTVLGEDYVFENIVENFNRVD